MNWNTSSTFTPVGLALHGQPAHKVVHTLGDAAYILIKCWPSDDGEEYVGAVKACVDAISGQIAPEQFREAFLRAADAAGIAAPTIVHR
ncbi:hypothetical protein IE4803_PD00103 (plasmid) [Rhizobium etli bv. phaseoli str. IE4803]|nr:hypothetical protein IE4803_PD00103 [Rhizobium etli bv. phaseoli str. IE4803]